MACACGAHRTPQACAGARFLSERSLAARRQDRAKQPRCACGRHRTASGCAGARLLAARTAEQRRAAGREGGRTNAILDRAAILDRYAHLDRDAAILAAFRDARQAMKAKRYRVHLAREKGSR